MKKFVIKKSHWLFRLYRFWFDEYYNQVKCPLPDTLCDLVFQAFLPTLFSAFIGILLLSSFILLLYLAFETHPLVTIGLIILIGLTILGTRIKDKYCPEIEYIND